MKKTYRVRAVNAFRSVGDRAAALNALAAATAHHPRSVALEALRTHLAKQRGAGEGRRVSRRGRLRSQGRFSRDRRRPRLLFFPHGLI